MSLLLMKGTFGNCRAWSARTADREKIRLLREFDAEAVEAGTLDVDDPYYGDMSDFEQCLAEVEAACRGVVEHVRDLQGARSAPPAGDEAP
ncbi:MAG: hypothetical protein V9G15_02490 [Dermatophilaceae bacterium]